MVSVQQYRSTALPRRIVSGRRSGIDATWQDAPDRAGGRELDGTYASGALDELALLRVSLESSIRARFGMERYSVSMSYVRFPFERPHLPEGRAERDFYLARNIRPDGSDHLLAAPPHGGQAIEST